MSSLKKWLPFKRGKEMEPAKGEASVVHPMIEMRSRMDRLFEEMMEKPFSGFFGGWDFDRWYGDFSPEIFEPKIDIADEKKFVCVTAELPGMDKEDIHLTVEENHLRIRGEKKTEMKKEEEGFYRAERFFGAFERAIPLPVDVDPDRAEARFEKGVLTVRLPKIEPASEPKKVEVQSA